MRAGSIVAAGGVIGAVGVAFAAAPTVGGPAFVVAGLLFMLAAGKDVAGEGQFQGNQRAMNAGVAAVGLSFLVIGIGILVS